MYLGICFIIHINFVANFINDDKEHSLNSLITMFNRCYLLHHLNSFGVKYNSATSIFSIQMHKVCNGKVPLTSPSPYHGIIKPQKKQKTWVTERVNHLQPTEIINVSGLFAIVYCIWSNYLCNTE